MVSLQYSILSGLDFCLQETFPERRECARVTLLLKKQQDVFLFHINSCQGAIPLDP